MLSKIAKFYSKFGHGVSILTNHASFITLSDYFIN